MEGNKNFGTYAFWIILLLIIVAVVVYFIIPKIDQQSSYKNITEASTLFSSEDLQHKTVKDYLNETYEIEYLDSGIKNDIYDLIQIQDKIFAFTDEYSKTALLFVNTKGDFGKNVSEQGKAVKELEKNINTLNSFLDSSYKNFLKSYSTDNSSIAPNVINDRVRPFVEKYKAIVKSYANIYSATSKVIAGNATQCYKINPLTTTANVGVCECLVRILEKSELSTSDINTLYNEASKVYSHNYYKNYFSGTTPESVKATLDAISA